MLIWGHNKIDVHISSQKLWLSTEDLHNIKPGKILK